MRLKLDENLPGDAAELLRALGHDVGTVVGEGLAGSPDGQVVSAAGREGRMLMTLDRGMADIRAYPPGSHPGIVVFRLDDQAATALVATFESFEPGRGLFRPRSLSVTLAIYARATAEADRLAVRPQGGVAQLAEHSAHNRVVVGSSPTAATRPKRYSGGPPSWLGRRSGSFDG